MEGYTTSVLTFLVICILIWVPIWYIHIYCSNYKTRVKWDTKSDVESGITINQPITIHRVSRRRNTNRKIYSRVRKRIRLKNERGKCKTRHRLHVRTQRNINHSIRCIASNRCAGIKPDNRFIIVNRDSFIGDIKANIILIVSCVKNSLGNQQHKLLISLLTIACTIAYKDSERLCIEIINISVFFMMSM